jgi:glycosyltransferase involved in cell wall biosynthesis
VDVHKFTPVPSDISKALKEKYGFDPDRPVLLHVGHMNKGRNIEELLKLDKKYQILLVTSTQFKDAQDIELKERLLNSGNIRLIDYYLPDIQEVYQLADAYFFPVVACGHCIDVPLSCLEAAACNKPVITTDYGEMKEFVGKQGFFFIDSFDPAELNSLVERALGDKDPGTRDAVLEYDWDNAISRFCDFE